MKNISFTCILTMMFSFTILTGCSTKDNSQSVPAEQTNDSDLVVEEEAGAAAINISIKINDSEYTATLEDNQSAREFAKRLPLIITMKEHNSNEKLYNFSEPLASDPQEINDINSGDLMLFGSDCLVLFYKSFQTAYSYTPLGSIDDPQGLSEALGSGSAEVSLE